MSVNSWIEFASGQDDILHLIPEDSVGYVFDHPFEKIQCWLSPPFDNFLQIPSIDTLILSSTGPYDNFILNWENTQSTPGALLLFC